VRVAVIGGGPAGLYLAYLLKRHHPTAEVRVLEQNPAGATFGFGVVFSDRALEFLRDDDPETCDAITPAMESWSDMTLDLEGRVVRIDGIGFSAIGRLRLLRLLQERARAAGVEVAFERTVASLDEVADADLVVGADGASSLVRRTHESELGASVRYLTNRFAWYGTTRRFDTLTQSFRRSAHGAFNAHHYRHAPDMSTVVVETDDATWRRAGFETMDAGATTAYLETVFADVLQGHPLVSNKSVWRSFPQVRNARWSAGRVVLLGDALHTAHFSIGSGTRLAMEDALALARAIRSHPGDLPAALLAYEAARRPILDKLTAAADASAGWYERFPEHMRLPPMEFAMSYITRSGRVSLDRLRRISPRFVAAYEADRRDGETAPGPAGERPRSP
jgi:2-polyprenyl-6-methoxyphenol hydroxylase-like FAD-dependent oxidoreductase